MIRNSAGQAPLSSVAQTDIPGPPSDATSSRPSGAQRALSRPPSCPSLAVSATSPVSRDDATHVAAAVHVHKDKPSVSRGLDPVWHFTVAPTEDLEAATGEPLKDIARSWPPGDCRGEVRVARRARDHLRRHEAATGQGRHRVEPGVIGHRAPRRSRARSPANRVASRPLRRIRPIRAPRAERRAVAAHRPRAPKDECRAD